MKVLSVMKVAMWLLVRGARSVFFFKLQTQKNFLNFFFFGTSKVPEKIVMKIFYLVIEIK